MANTPLAAVIYSRVSFDGADGRSVQEQESDGREACGREGWRVAASFVDNGISASRYSKTKVRPGYDELLAYLEREPVNILVIWEPSRGSRRMGEWASLLDLCADKRIRVHVVSDRHTYDPREDRDYGDLLDDGVDSVKESGKTRKRTLRAMRLNVTDGKPHGALLYGYDRDYETGPRGKQVYKSQFIDEKVQPWGTSRASVVRELFARVSAGEGMRGIANDLNARGIPTPRGREEWRNVHVRAVVTNPAYAEWGGGSERDEKHPVGWGHRVWRPKDGSEGGMVRGDWPALIDRETWERVADLLADPTRRKATGNAAVWILSGVAVCGRVGEEGDPCRGRLQVVRVNGGGGRVYESRPCGHVSVDAAAADGYVVEEVVARLGKVSLAALSGLERDQEREGAVEELAELRQALADAERQWKRPARGTKRLSAGAYAELESELRPLIEDARRRSRFRRVPEVIARVVEEPAEFRELEVSQQKFVLRHLFDITVEPVGRGRRGVPISERVRIWEPGTLGNWALREGVLGQ